MFRVSVKNTFLTFEEDGQLEAAIGAVSPTGASPRSAASPRSRSLEAPRSPSPGHDGTHASYHTGGACGSTDAPEKSQIDRLNKMMSPQGGSPRTIGSRVGSPSPHSGGSPRQSASMGAEGSADMTQLQQKLEEISVARNVRRVNSNGSVSTMDGGLASDHEQDMVRAGDGTSRRGSWQDMSPKPRMPYVNSSGSLSSLGGSDQCLEGFSPKPQMPYVRSHESLSSMGGGSEFLEEANGFCAEFDLVIEEEPHNARQQVQAVEQPSCTVADVEVLSPAHAGRVDTEAGDALRSLGVAANHERSRASGSDAEQVRGSSGAVAGGPPLPPTPAEVVADSIAVSGQDLTSQDANGQSRSLPKEYRHGHVPKNLNLSEEFAKTESIAPPTTLMIRNIPNRYTQRELIQELETLGFAGTFDFLYIPLDKGTMSNVGYAFVNFVASEWAEKCMAAFENYRFKRHRKVSGKIAAVSVAHIQGLEANIRHYENAAVNTAKLKQRRPVIVANISQTLSSALGIE